MIEDATQPPPVKPGRPIPHPMVIRAEGMEIARELTTIKHKLGALGLFKSMHAVDACTMALGYELADAIG